jgi:hypothetical protein
MPRVVFEPTNLVFERAKMVHALDRTATVIGKPTYADIIILNKSYHPYEYKSLANKQLTV